MVFGVPDFLKHGKYLGQFHFFGGFAKISGAGRDDFVLVPLYGLCQPVKLCDACLAVKIGPSGKLCPNLGVKRRSDVIGTGCFGGK
jgi:hypothetical protein